MKPKISLEDLIDREARALARDRLEHQLAIENLPLPKESALELHINQLLAADSSIFDEAKKNVEARTDAYTAGLQSLGFAVAPPNIKIDL